MSPRMTRFVKRFYVMAASEKSERERAERFSLRCEAAGWVNTRTWWDDFQKREREGILNEYREPSEREFVAEADLEGVYRASLVFLLKPPQGIYTEGAWAELGYALALRRCRQGSKPLIWTVTDFPESRRFFSLKADRTFDTEDLAVEALAALI